MHQVSDKPRKRRGQAHDFGSQIRFEIVGLWSYRHYEWLYLYSDEKLTDFVGHFDMDHSHDFEVSEPYWQELLKQPSRYHTLYIKNGSQWQITFHLNAPHIAPKNGVRQVSITKQLKPGEVGIWEFEIKPGRTELYMPPFELAAGLGGRRGGCF